MTPTIVLSDKAHRQLQALNVSRDNFLRVWVEAGGCSGMLYQAAIDTQIGPEDRILYEDEYLRILSDPQSANFFEGVHVDYSDDLVKAGFRFHNPGAVRSCGCGSSFSCAS